VRVTEESMCSPKMFTAANAKEATASPSANAMVIAVERLIRHQL